MTALGSVRCTICEADDPHTLFRPRHSPGPVVRCGRCGLVYVSPREDAHALICDGPVLSQLPPATLRSSDTSALAGCWELQLLAAKETESVALQHNAALALDQIARHLSPPGRLLDFGCGGGFFLREAAARGWETFGLEPLAGHALYARSVSGATVVADTLRENTFPPEFFDVVTSFQVFEHLPDPSAELGKLKRILKPGGLLLIEVPNIKTWSVSLLGKHHRHFVPDHLYFFSPDTLTNLIVKHDLEPVAIYFPKRYMTLRHLLAGWGSRTLGPQIGGALGRMIKRLRLERSIVPVGLGDIVALIARKPV